MVTLLVLLLTYINIILFWDKGYGQLDRITVSQSHYVPYLFWDGDFATTEYLYHGRIWLHIG